MDFRSRRLGRVIPALLLTLFFFGIGCSSDDDDDASVASTSPPAAEDFTSALSGNGGQYSDAPSAGGDAAAEDDGDGGDREVEEADILVQDGDTLYILNPYRGLMLFDVSNADAPRFMSRVSLTGYPVEMYVREGRAYIVVSDYFTYWRVYDEAGTSTSSFYGSMLAIVDVLDGANPAILGTINLEGFVSQTRAVGDVIYAVSTRYSYYSCGAASDDTEDTTTVMSIDISDPYDPHTVDTLSWPGSWSQVHATSHSLYVVEPDYNYDGGAETVEPEGEPAEEGDEGGDEGGGSDGSADSGSAGEGTTTTDDHSDPVPTPTSDDGDNDATPAPDEGNPVDAEPPPDDGSEPTERPDDGGEPTERPEGDDPDERPDDTEPQASYYTTHITYIDISDPHGVMTERGRIDVPGYTMDKNALDEYDSTFRIVTQKWDGVTSGTLSIIDVSNPDALTQISSFDLVLDISESVTAALFDGNTGYIVTAAQSDPLFIIDLEDPTHPTVVGVEEMSGQLNHLELLGDRIVAFGQDTEDEGSWKFAVSLFDVSVPSDPILLAREHIGDGDYSWSQATWDDKSFSLIPDDDDPDDLGLIAVPFYAYDYGDDYYYYYTTTGGVQLLEFDSQNLYKRGMVTHPGYVTRVRQVNDRLASLSDTRLLMIDAQDPDNPSVTRDISLARNVMDYTPMGDVGVQLTLPSWYDGGSDLAAMRVVPGDRPDLVGDDEQLAQIDLDIDDGQLIALSDTLVSLVSTQYDESWNARYKLEVYDVSSPESPVRVSSLELPAPVWSSVYNWYGYYYGSSGGVLVKTGNVLAYLETEYDYYYYGYPVEDTAVDAEPAEPSSGGADAAEPPPSGKLSKVAFADDEGDKEPDSDATPAEDTPATRLHVIDLSDPAHPQLHSFDFEQSLFGLWANGNRLYATHAEPIDGEAEARYYVDIIDVSDPSAPVVSPPVNIPGTAMHALDGGSTLVTLDSQWKTNSDGYDYLEYSFNTVGLRGNGAYLKDRIVLPGYVQSLYFSDDGAYVMTQDYYWNVDWEYYCGYYGYPVYLHTIDLRQPEALREANEQRLPISYGMLRGLEQDRLFVDGYSQGMLVYDVGTDPMAPTFVDSVRTSGWVTKIRARDNNAYLPAGMYGVFTVGL